MRASLRVIAPAARAEREGGRCDPSSAPRPPGPRCSNRRAAPQGPGKRFCNLAVLDRAAHSIFSGACVLLRRSIGSGSSDPSPPRAPHLVQGRDGNLRFDVRQRRAGSFQRRRSKSSPGGVNSGGDKNQLGMPAEMVGSAELGENAFEFVEVGVFDDQPALAAARMLDAHLGAEPFGELLLQQTDIGVDGAARGGVAAGFAQ